jgi:hypothetical protein
VSAAFPEAPHTLRRVPLLARRVRCHHQSRPSMLLPGIAFPTIQHTRCHVHLAVGVATSRPASRSCSSRSPLSRPTGFPSGHARSFLGLLLPLQGLSAAAALGTASSAWTPWVGRAPCCPSLRMALPDCCDPPAALPSRPEGGGAVAGSVQLGVTWSLTGAGPSSEDVVPWSRQRLSASTFMGFCTSKSALPEHLRRGWVTRSAR